MLATHLSVMLAPRSLTLWSVRGMRMAVGSTHETSWRNRSRWDLVSSGLREDPWSASTILTSEESKFRLAAGKARTDLEWAEPIVVDCLWSVDVEAEGWWASSNLSMCWLRVGKSCSSGKSTSGYDKGMSDQLSVVAGIGKEEQGERKIFLSSPHDPCACCHAWRHWEHQ